MSAIVAARQLRGVVRRVIKLQGTRLASFGTKTVSETVTIPSTFANRPPNEISVLPQGLNFSFKKESKTTCVHDLDLSEALSNLSLSTTEIGLTTEYLLPSLYPNSMLTILDPVSQPKLHDCPTHISNKIIDAPPTNTICRIECPNGSPVVEKHARRIMKIRHRKMKKHKYRKWRKRNKFKIRAILMQRRKRKLKIWQAHLDTYRFKGLTNEYIEWYLDVKRDEKKIFLKHLGIPLEEDPTQETEEIAREKLKAQKKKELYRYLPRATMKVIPEPIVPERSSLTKVIADDERRATIHASEVEKS